MVNHVLKDMTLYPKQQVIMVGCNDFMYVVIDSTILTIVFVGIHSAHRGFIAPHRACDVYSQSG